MGSGRPVYHQLGGRLLSAHSKKGVEARNLYCKGRGLAATSESCLWDRQAHALVVQLRVSSSSSLVPDWKDDRC